MTATTSEIVTHLLLDWIGFLIPAYIAYRIARFLIGYRWPPFEKISGEDVRLQGLYEVSHQEFSILDYPNRLLAVAHCKLRGIQDNRRLLLNFGGLIRFNFVAIFIIGIFLAIFLGIIAITHTTSVLLSVENFQNFPEFYDEYARIPAFLLNISIKIQLFCCIFLISAGISSLHSNVFRITFDKYLGYFKKNTPKISEKTPYGFFKRPALGIFNCFIGASLPIMPYFLLIRLLPEMAEPNLREIEEIWEMHFLWPAFFVTMSSFISLTIFLPGLLLQYLVGDLVRRIRS